MMPAVQVQAVVEVLARRTVPRAGAGEKLEPETVVVGRREQGERQAALLAAPYATEIQLLAIPVTSGLEVATRTPAWSPLTDRKALAGFGAGENSGMSDLVTAIH